MDEMKIEKERKPWELFYDFAAAFDRVKEAEKELVDANAEIGKLEPKIIALIQKHGAIKHGDKIFIIENGYPKAMEFESSASI